MKTPKKVKVICDHHTGRYCYLCLGKHNKSHIKDKYECQSCHCTRANRVVKCIKIK